MDQSPVSPVLCTVMPDWAQTVLSCLTISSPRQRRLSHRGGSPTEGPLPTCTCTLLHLYSANSYLRGALQSPLQYVFSRARRDNFQDITLTITTTLPLLLYYHYICTSVPVCTSVSVYLEQYICTTLILK